MVTGTTSEGTPAMLDPRPEVSRFLRTWPLSKGSVADAELMARPEDARTIAIMRAAVDPVRLDSATAPAFASLSSTILESLAAQSALDGMLASGSPPLSYGPGATSIVATVITGGNVAEGAPKPIGTFSMSSEGLQPAKAVCTAVVSDDLLQSMRGGEVVQQLLRASITDATNAVLADLLASLAVLTPITASGTAVANVLQDIAAAAAAIGARAGSRLVLIVSPSTLIELALMPGAAGPVLLDLRTDGGNVAGVQVYGADSLVGTAIVLDASRIGIADGGLALSLASSATLAMDDAGAGAPTFSLWQRNRTAVRAERPFGVALSSDAGSSPIV